MLRGPGKFCPCAVMSTTLGPTSSNRDEMFLFPIGILRRLIYVTYMALDGSENALPPPSTLFVPSPWAQVPTSHCHGPWGFLHKAWPQVADLLSDLALLPDLRWDSYTYLGTLLAQQPKPGVVCMVPLPSYTRYRLARVPDKFVI